MSVDTINYLNKQKKKLTLIFTMTIFILIIAIETSFLIFKYVDYKKQQFQRLNSQISIISRMPPDFNFPSNGTFIPQPRNGDPRIVDSLRRARSENLIMLDKRTSEIIFSSLNDKDIAEEIIDKVLEGDSLDTVNYNGIDFFYLSQDINPITRAYIFTQSKITLSDVFNEFLEYTSFLLLFSVFLYYFGYKFVSYNLSPVEENIKDMEQFIFNAGHELKTPLAVMRSSLELAKAKNDYKDLTIDTIKEIGKMNLLIESLINLSTLNKTVKSEKISLEKNISEIISDYESQIKDKDIVIEAVINNKAEIHMNNEHFRILFSNLLSNAIKYNIPGGTIKITADRGYMSVKDSGIGIKKENLGRVFDRFFMEEEGRNQESLGIGLSLVKKISEIYGFDIKVDSESEKGTEIKIIF
ncbi:MAG: HAMP domain-containing sensor histidine kinase [Candidatus Gracilibacteria bacterium]|nr:HAMP domain-containing sensor histidine kinase [Candidatus Gracilibacteria bacterium]